MGCKTVEVELQDGRVLPSGSEILPRKAHALLTLLESNAPRAARTCGELAERWSTLEKLPPDEAAAFANDIERARANLQPVKREWNRSWLI